jgi:hypothetical protein
LKRKSETSEIHMPPLSQTRDMGILSRQKGKIADGSAKKSLTCCPDFATWGNGCVPELRHNQRHFRLPGESKHALEW